MDPSDDHRQAVGLFRYSLIREAADPALSARQRGALVRALASRDHLGPDGTRVRVGRNTLDRWIRAWRAGGFAALVPDPRAGVPLTPPAVLELAARLKRDAPERTAAQVAAILGETNGWSPHPRTLQRHFARLRLQTTGDRPAKAYGRFQADAPNDLWTADALHGPTVAGRKAYLFAAIDDHSRALVGYRWAHAEDTLRLEAALRAGFAARGLPKLLYVDNGAAFVSRQLERACAILGIRLAHSTPGQPQGRGKVERVFRTVREQFLVELDARGGAGDLAELNRLFAAWVEGVYHTRVHTETGCPPLERFLLTGAPALPAPAQLREAFLWAERRRVTKTATLSLHGNRYQVDPALVGHEVELVFDPFDLTRVEVRYAGRAMGLAVPDRIGRHVHPQAAAAATDTAPPARPSGIDYLALVEERVAAATRRRIAYAELADPDPAVHGRHHGTEAAK
ncbi:MAG TPA: DDE-type integrase/transposase/recombinase [Actinomycetota bacterium]|nr:DDE-type integrase/transposase/recombinase [Actinomycetota bacterium]